MADMTEVETPFPGGPQSEWVDISPLDPRYPLTPVIVIEGKPRAEASEPEPEAGL